MDEAGGSPQRDLLAETIQSAGAKAIAGWVAVSVFAPCRLRRLQSAGCAGAAHIACAAPIPI